MSRNRQILALDTVACKCLVKKIDYLQTAAFLNICWEIKNYAHCKVRHFHSQNKIILLQD